MLVLSQPQWLWLLPIALVPFLLSALKKAAAQDYSTPRMLLLHPDMHGLSVIDPIVSFRHMLTVLLNSLALFLIVTALAQPQWIGDFLPNPPEGREMMLLLDTSKTMSIDDFQLNAQPVERIQVLKGLVSKFVKARAGDQFGLIAFGSTAATLTPPTFDRELVVNMLQRLPIGVLGDDTALGDALGLALKQLRENPKHRPALILFTDGVNTSGLMSPREAVEIAIEMKVPIYTVEIGTDLFGHNTRPAPQAEIHNPRLLQISQLTKGRHYQATSPEALEAIIRDIGALEKTIAPPLQQRHVVEAFPFVLLLAASFLSFNRALEILRRLQ